MHTTLFARHPHAPVHARPYNGAEISLPWKQLRTYHESCASIVQAVVCRPLLPPLLLSRPNPSPDAVCSRNPSKCTLAHDAVATAVSHKHHSIIRVGTGLMQFVYGSHSRLALELILHKILFPPFFSRASVITLCKAEILMFFACRPDGVAFNDKDKERVFLDFTRPMNSVISSEEGEWAEGTEAEKHARYAHHRYFINYLSARRCKQLKCTQINFNVGVRGSLKETQFDERLTLLGVSNSNARDNIRIFTVSMTLAFSDIILKLFHTSILRSPEWALSSLPTEIANTNTARLHLFKKFKGPFSGLVL